jgi:hypothetical protein
MNTVFAVTVLTLLRLVIPVGLLLWIGDRLHRREWKTG